MGQGDTSQVELTRAKRELTKTVADNKRLDALCRSLKEQLDTAEYNVRDLEADLAVRVHRTLSVRKGPGRVRLRAGSFFVILFLLYDTMFKAQSNSLVKEVKTKEKLEDRMKIDRDQMEKIKSELGATKNSLKKAESTVEKLNETLKDIKVIENADRVYGVTLSIG